MEPGSHKDLIQVGGRDFVAVGLSVFRNVFHQFQFMIHTGLIQKFLNLGWASKLLKNPVGAFIAAEADHFDKMLLNDFAVFQHPFFTGKHVGMKNRKFDQTRRFNPTPRPDRDKQFSARKILDNHREDVLPLETSASVEIFHVGKDSRFQ